MAVAITCGYGGYLLPLLATHSSYGWPMTIFVYFVTFATFCLKASRQGCKHFIKIPQTLIWYLVQWSTFPQAWTLFGCFCNSLDIVTCLQLTQWSSGSSVSKWILQIIFYPAAFHGATGYRISAGVVDSSCGYWFSLTFFPDTLRRLSTSGYNIKDCRVVMRHDIHDTRWWYINNIAVGGIYCLPTHRTHQLGCHLTPWLMCGMLEQWQHEREITSCSNDMFKAF